MSIAYLNKKPQHFLWGFKYKTNQKNYSFTIFTVLVLPSTVALTK